MADFVQESYRRHAQDFSVHVQGGSAESLGQSWLNTDTVDYWRHARMYACVDPLLENNPGASWLTVGDGRYGRDAWYLSQHGAKAVASDISDDLLKEGKAKGYIAEYSKENAEALSYPDDAFDFVFCKESYHHFPRPMLALYEMLRVAKRGVVLIEPNESPVLGGLKFIFKRIVKRVMLLCRCASRLRTPDTSVFLPYGNTYETCGNYVYTLSEREVEKVALGMNLPAAAFMGLNDWYIKGVEQELYGSNGPLESAIKREINKADQRARRGLNLGAPFILVSCIFKSSPTAAERNALTEAGFRVVDLMRNPFISETDLKRRK